MKVAFSIPTYKRPFLALKVFEWLNSYGDVFFGIQDEDDFSILNDRLSRKSLIWTPLGPAASRRELLINILLDDYDVIINTDDDVSYCKGSVDEYLEYFDRGYSIVGCSITGDPYKSVKLRSLDRDEMTCGPNLYAWWGIRREIFNKVGGIDERITFGEDQDVLIRGKVLSDIIMTKKLTINHVRHQEGGFLKFAGKDKTTIKEWEQQKRLKLFQDFLYPKYNLILRNSVRGYNIISPKKLNIIREMYREGQISIDEYKGIEIKHV